MTFDERIEGLERQRAGLKEKIAAENARPHPDALALMRMKKMKCRLKDEIARLRQDAESRTSSAA